MQIFDVFVNRHLIDSIELIQMLQMAVFVWLTLMENIQRLCMTTKNAMWKVWKNILLSIKSSAKEKNETNVTNKNVRSIGRRRWSGLVVVERIKKHAVSWNARHGSSWWFRCLTFKNRYQRAIWIRYMVLCPLMLAIYDKTRYHWQDRVAMCVNDIIAPQVLEPLYLDYIATGKMNLLN